MWSRLFGPVLICDLVRMTRRGTSATFVVRSTYVGLLFLFFMVFHGAITGKGEFDFPLSRKQAADLARYFFLFVLIAQLAATLLLAPAYLVGALARERERRTLDALLATDLSSREIVLGKLLPRLINLVAPLLASLPVLCAVQLWTGADPILILTSVVTTGLMMASLGALAALQSIYAHRVSEALFRTYLIIGAYLLITTLCWLPDHNSLADAPSGLKRIVGILGMGNPLLAADRLWDVISKESLDPMLGEFLADFSFFHGLLFLGGITWAIRRLRPCATTSPATPTERFVLALRAGRPDLDNETILHLAHSLRRPSDVPLRPPLRNQPLLWKELHVEPGPFDLFGTWGFVLRCSLVLGLMTAGLVFLLLVPIGMTLDRLGELMNLWTSATGTTLAVLLVVGVAMRSACAFSRERERQTLDSLLASGLSNRAIINGKWLGSLLSVRAGWGWLVVVWLAGALAGGISWVTLPLLFLACLTYTAAAASVGLICSLMSPRTRHAITSTLLLLLLLGVAPLVRHEEPTPVEALMALALPGWGASGSVAEAAPRWDGFSILGSLFNGALFAAFGWCGAHWLFADITGRMPAGERKSAPIPSAPPGPFC